MRKTHVQHTAFKLSIALSLLASVACSGTYLSEEEAAELGATELKTAEFALMGSGGGGGAGPGGSFPYCYSDEHGDLEIEIEVTENDCEVEIKAHLGAEAIVNGEAVGGAGGHEYNLDELLIATSLKFQRPSSDGGAYAPLCVPQGHRVWHLPEDPVSGTPHWGFNTEEICSGLLENDRLSIGVVGVTPPKPYKPWGYSMWQGGLPQLTPPAFVVSTCGAPDPDKFFIDVGAHDHYSHGFAGLKQKGVWDVTYKVKGKFEENKCGGGWFSKNVTVHYLTGKTCEEYLQ